MNLLLMEGSGIAKNKLPQQLSTTFSEGTIGAQDDLKNSYDKTRKYNALLQMLSLQLQDCASCKRWKLVWDDRQRVCGNGKKN
jgi:hypothetical protein